MAKILLAKNQENKEVWIWKLNEIRKSVAEDVEYLEGRILEVKDGIEVLLRQLWDFEWSLEKEYPDYAELIKLVFKGLYEKAKPITREDLEKLIKEEK